MFNFRRKKKRINPYLKKIPEERFVPFRIIKVKEAAEMISNKNLTDLIILDVRTRREYNIAHIKESINIDINFLKNYTYLLDKNYKILLYCNSGNKAVKAAYLLYYMGYDKLFIWEGGSINSMIPFNLVE